MISRIVSRVGSTCIQVCLKSSPLLSMPKYRFTKVPNKRSLQYYISCQIKSEQQNLNNLSTTQSSFIQKGWKLSNLSTLLQLQKKIGKHHVRLLSNVKSPSTFDQQKDKQRRIAGQQEEEQDYSQVIVAVTKDGRDKTMVITVMVAEEVQFTNIYFVENYQVAKHNRFDIVQQNKYLGPEVDALREDLVESISEFVEDDLAVTTDLMREFADYCMDREQSFYICWLKDMKSII